MERYLPTLELPADHLGFGSGPAGPTHSSGCLVDCDVNATVTPAVFLLVHENNGNVVCEQQEGELGLQVCVRLLQTLGLDHLYR